MLPGVGPIIAIGAGALIGGMVGGATGGISAGVMDMGIKNTQLEALATHLSAGRIAMVLEIEGEATAREKLREDLKSFQTEFVDN